MYVYNEPRSCPNALPRNIENKSSTLLSHVRESREQQSPRISLNVTQTYLVYVEARFSRFLETDFLRILIQYYRFFHRPDLTLRHSFFATCWYRNVLFKFKRATSFLNTIVTTNTLRLKYKHYHWSSFVPYSTNQRASPFPLPLLSVSSRSQWVKVNRRTYIVKYEINYTRKNRTSNKIELIWKIDRVAN